jgi:glycine betaine/proline transport system substrate-binding protein
MTFTAGLRAAALSALLGAGTLSAAAEPVVIGQPSWPTGEVTANILATVLKDRYGLDAQLKPYGTAELFEAIDRGEAHVHPEVWLPNDAVDVAYFTETRKSLALAPARVIATQNICTTRATVEATGISAVSDLADPEMAAKFDTDGDGLGEMWIGAEGWVATPVERIRAKSYGYDQTMTLLEMPEDVAMAAVDAAAATSSPIVFYCYAPHHVFALHEIVRLKEPPYDAASWAVVKPADSAEWLEVSRAASGWQPAFTHVGWAPSFAEANPEAAAFLSAFALTDADAEAMSYAVDVDGEAPEAVAARWIAENAAKIEEWTR